MAGGLPKQELFGFDLTEYANEIQKVTTSVNGLLDALTDIKKTPEGIRELNKVTKEQIDNAKKLVQYEKELNTLRINAANAIIAEEKSKQALLRTEKLENTEKQKSNKLTGQAASEAKLLAQANTAAAGSFDQLNAKYKLNIIELNSMSEVQRTSSIRAKELIDENTILVGKLNSLDAQSGKTKRAFNGLQWQVSQLARELPSMAYGMNVFFGAISNNLPMLIDEIKAVGAANKIAAAEGRATVPVWKQVGGAILNWQSAILIGLTFLTLYGKEIIAWTGNLFKGKNALDATKKAQEDYNAATLKGMTNAQDEIVTLRILYNAATDTTKSLKERNAAVDEMQRLYPNYLGNISDEKILAGGAATEYMNLTNSILAASKARAYQDTIVENEKKIIELEKVIGSDAAKNLGETLGWSKAFGASTSLIGTAIEAIGFNKFENDVKNAKEEIDSLRKSNEKLAKGINITDLIADQKSKSLKTPKDTKKEERQSAADKFQFYKKINDEIYANEVEQRDKLGKESDDFFKSEEKRMKDESQIAIENLYAQINEETLAIQERYATEIELAGNNKDKIAQLQRELTKEIIAEQIKRMEAEAATGKVIGDDYTKLLANIQKLKIAYSKEDSKNTSKTEEEKQREREEYAGASQRLLSEGAAFAQTLFSAQEERAKQAYEAETAAAGNNLEQQIIAKRKFEAEDKKIKKRQAIASKLQAVFDAGLALALAIATTWKDPFLAVLNIAAATIGLATAIATPLPAFAEGVEDFEGGLAILGDGTGRKAGRELVEEPSGKKWLSGSKPMVYDLAKGSTVIPADRTAEMLSNMAINQFGSIVDMTESNKHLSNIEKGLNKKDPAPYFDSKGRMFVKRGSTTYIYASN